MIVVLFQQLNLIAYRRLVLEKMFSLNAIQLRKLFMPQHHQIGQVTSTIDCKPLIRAISLVLQSSAPTKQLSKHN